MERNVDLNKLGSALILALGVIILGLCIKAGIDGFANKDRKVVVKRTGRTRDSC